MAYPHRGEIWLADLRRPVPASKPSGGQCSYSSKSSIMSKTSDRYVKVVAWSEEDQCYVGRCPGLMLGGVHGSDERAVYAELCEAVDEWIRLHEAEGRPLPRSTSLREIEALV
jgi:predicted RNase H-like HicB family nuclease